MKGIGKNNIITSVMTLKQLIDMTIGTKFMQCSALTVGSQSDFTGRHCRTSAKNCAME